MTRFLGTGESEYCLCVHHLTELIMRLGNRLSLLQHRPAHSYLRGRSGNMSHPIRDCHCDEFRSYRIVGEDEEVVANKIREVIQA
jgi:hypothetical protein